MTTILDDIAKAHADNDPHDFKSQGANGAKTGHVNQPYVKQDFPTTVYKDKDSKVVKDADELKTAKAAGWGDKAPEPAKVPAPEPAK